MATRTGENLSRWGQRLRRYVLAFIPPPADTGGSAQPLQLDAAGVVRMIQEDRSALFGRDIEISTPRVDRIDYRDSAETALRIARARSVTWIDAAGRREPWNSIWVSGTRLVVDRMLEPVHLRRHLKALEALIREGPIRVPKNAALDRCLYLRLDTVSGLVAGGAVAHTVGIVGALRNRVSDLAFVCFERLAALPADIEASVVPVKSRSAFGPNNPIVGFEAIVYHAPMLQRLDELNRSKRPAFIYQRFCQGQY
ncbi:MAG: hypothetical protein WAL40_11775, partial [Rhodoplanes sp.]